MLDIANLTAEQNASQSLSEGNFTDQCQFVRDNGASRLLSAGAGAGAVIKIKTNKKTHYRFMKNK